MKTFIAAIVFLAVQISAAPPPISLSAAVAGDQLHLAWGDGKPTYQLQMREDLDSPWANVGAPTASASAEVPLPDGQAFFRVVQDYTARFQVQFDATWSSATHPESFPAGAHWSGLVGGVHSDRVYFWREGETASTGIQLMAERGSKSTLLTEIAPAMANGSAHFTLSGGGIGTSPGRTTLIFPQPMRRDFPLVTLCSMIAPSPDWFVGVDSESLIEDNEWITTKTVTLYGFDAGTDSGPSYASPDQVTTPRGIITRFTGFPALVDGEIVPFGTFTFTRLD